MWLDSGIAALPPLEQTDVPQFDYPLMMRVQQLAVTILSLFAAVMLLSLKLLLVLWGVMGFVGKQILGSVLAAWFAVSAVQAAT